MRNPKIIVTSGGWQASLACIQSLGRRGCDVYLLSHQAKSLPFSHSRFCKGILESPPEKDEEAFVAFVDRILKAQEFDLFIPISDDCVRYGSRYYDQWSRRVRLLLAPPQSIQMASSKKETALMALRHDIDIPVSFFPKDLNEIADLSYQDIYPCVVKVPVSFANNGVFFIHNRLELMELYEQQPFQGQWPFIQKFVEGDFYGLTAVAVDGEVQGTPLMFRASQDCLIGGNLPYVFSFFDPRLTMIAQKAIRILHWSGSIDFDFLKSTDGRYVLLEINPRFSGTLNLAYKLGLDIPWSYWCLSQGLPLEPKAWCSYPEGVMYRTLFPVEMLWDFKRKGMVEAVMGLFRPLHSQTNVYWDDPQLLLWQMKETRWLIQRTRAAQAASLPKPAPTLVSTPIAQP